jgi:hypothetical protein
LRKAASRFAFSSREPACKNPITGIADDWACAASGNAATPPSHVRNCRRFMAISFRDFSLPANVAQLRSTLRTAQLR